MYFKLTVEKLLTPQNITDKKPDPKAAIGCIVIVELLALDSYYM